MKILIPISGRSDAGLVAPIIKRLRTHGHYALDDVLQWGPKDDVSLADCALICGDRVEMVPFAFKCFISHVPIVHLYAGITNSIATFDDLGRHCITLLSDVQFCENEEAYSTTLTLLNAVKKYDTKTYCVGITHLDDLEMDESQCPRYPYDLILYNPPTLTADMELELGNIQAILNTSPCKFAIFVEPNNDEGRDIIKKTLYSKYEIEFENYPRPQFLGLLKNCNKFITNSSVEFYEAPHFLTPAQIIHVGLRNKERSSKGPLQPGASDKIVTILEELYDGR